jgi:hypothetical protein
MVFLDERMHASFEALFQRPMEDLVNRGPAYYRFHLDLAEEARELMRTM